MFYVNSSLVTRIHLELAALEAQTLELSMTHWYTLVDREWPGRNIVTVRLRSLHVLFKLLVDETALSGSRLASRNASYGGSSQASS